MDLKQVELPQGILDDYLQQSLAEFPEQSGAASRQRLQQLLLASPFLGRILQQQPELLPVLTAPEQLLSWLKGITADPLAGCSSADESLAFSRLRQARNARLAAILAADILQLQPVTESLKAVSALADTLINSAYHWSWQQLTTQWGTPCDELGEPMPMLILGMGKLGGHELNFSSDIDLIFTYPAHGETRGGRRAVEHQQFYTRLGQKLISALHQVTADGFVYRVDMRLRPFGDSGPLALSFAAMEDYYQEQGREWERYALLKARVLNPDKRYTPELQQLLKPFIYRRYIDFSAIESLRRMKQLIEQENRRQQRYNNIKLGPGGIREVEFIVQTLQLIRGGRQTQLQQPSILKAMQVLAEQQLFSAEQHQQLQQDYLFLRQVEQALQGIDDKQTQTLPEDSLTQAHLLAALNAHSWPQLLQQITATMQRIHQQFRLVIDPEDNTESQDLALGRMLWDSEHSPEELASQLDWLDTTQATAMLEWLQAFRGDSQKRSIGPRGRDYLARLMPPLIQLLQQQQSQPVVLERVLSVLRHIMTRTAYLELLFENPRALQQLVLLCTQSGWLAEQLSRYPLLLDELIDPAQLYQVAKVTDYADRLREQMLRVPDDDLELQMEMLRQYKQSQLLRIAAADISGVLPLMKVSDHLSWLAEALVRQVIELAWQQMVSRYGYPAGASEQQKGLAVIAYGKLGGLELGYGSDLDLVFVHNCDTTADTNGDKAIDSRQFYLKLVQRILHLCTTRTSSGVLYEVDTRLRPSGNSGLLAINITTYKNYLEAEAWTWEHQALVRARLIAGETELTQQFEQIRCQIISKQREPQALREDVISMRDKLRQHHGEQAGDLKHSAGGIVDLEFLSQYLVLAYGWQYPALYRYTDNIRILEAAADCGLLTTEQSHTLQEAYQLLRGVGHRLTLAPATLPDSSRLADARAAIQQSWQQFLG